MRSDSQGIQQLLVAEKRAEEKISQARKRKAARLKQAKEEAQAEVVKYRELKENQFKEYELTLGSVQESAAQIETETLSRMKEMSNMVEAAKTSVIKCLLDQVFLIKPVLHENFMARRAQ